MCHRPMHGPTTALDAPTETGPKRMTRGRHRQGLARLPGEACYLCRVPELPEVERGARILAAAAIGRTLAAARVLHPAYRRRLPDDHAARLAGRAIVAVARRGKHQLATIDDGSTLEIHFRMSGEWLVGRAADQLPRFARVVLDFTDGTRAVLSDSRALGTARLHPPDAVALPALGPEPLGPAFTADALGAALERRRTAIKAALLDQRVVAGIGNIYAAEALWLARIDPRTPAAALGPARRTRLVRAIRAVLRRAQRAASSAAPDGGPDDGRENGPDSWRVYDRDGRPCRRCRARIRRITQGGRSTYYCPRCQR